MPKARFMFREEGSLEIVKGDVVLNLGKRELEVLIKAFERTQLKASQIGLSEDFIKYPYKVR